MALYDKVFYIYLKGKVKALAETYFKKRFRGYDPEQVDAFIISLSDTYNRNEENYNEDLRNAESENSRLREEIAEMRKYIEELAATHEANLAKKQEEYDILYAQIGEKMVVADSRAEEIVRSAEKEANLIIAEARQKGENEAKTIRENAEAEAKSLIEETQRKCSDISAAAEEFRMKQEEMNKSMSETEKRFGDALSKLREGFGVSNDNQ